MIQSLRLTNFKNFQDATLSLGKLTLLVGTNASGKSNLRDAFRFLHGMARGYNLAEIIGEKYIEGGVLQWKGIRGGVREVARYGTSFSRLETRIVIEDVTLTHRIAIDLGDNGGRPRIARESLEYNDKMAFDSHPNEDPPTQTDPPFLYVRLPRDKQNRKHGKRLQFSDQQPILTQFPCHRQTKLELRVYANGAIDSLSSMRFLDLTPEAMRLPSLPGQIILGDRGENLSSVLQVICEAPEKKQAILEWIRQLTPLDVEDFDFVADQTGRILVTLIEAGGRRTSAYSASDGTLRFLAMIAAMLGPDPARFYFFEELDTGIHPTRLQLLLQLIEQTVSREDIQVVATTHSPQMLGFLGESSREAATLVYRLPHHGEARLRRILDIPEARQVLATRTLGRLHESGWLENAVTFLETQPNGNPSQGKVFCPLGRETRFTR